MNSIPLFRRRIFAPDVAATAAGFERRDSRTLQKFAERLLSGMFLAWSAYYLATALCAIANFAWRQPMSDQWRMYRTLLTTPFPQNFLQLENGHRPIVPNIFRLAEVHWLHADQLLQAGAGIGCAVLSAALIARVAWRERALPLAARSAGVMLAVLGFFWLANSRILMHGNEALHAYLLVLSVVTAALCTYRAKESGSIRGIVLASAACTVAMFCFGPGVAGFPEVVGLGVALRLPWRWQLVPLGTLALCLALYLVVLPGDSGVCGMLALRPLDSLMAMARWLSSPWAHAWLGFAPPALQADLQGAVDESMVGRVLTGSARALAGTGIAWPSLSAAIGAAGAIAFLFRVAVLYLRRERVVPVQALAIATGLFALLSACVFGMTRLAYLDANPAQVYADRYLIWSCLFWMALATLALVDAARRRSAALAAALLVLALLPIVLLPTHEAWTGWAAAAFRNAQRIAAAARSGFYDPAVFPDGDDASRDDVTVTLALMKQRRLAMFAEPAWQRLGTRWPGIVGTDDAYRVDVRWLPPASDPKTGRTAGRIEGAIASGIARAQRSGVLAVIDERGVVAGFGEYSFIGTASKPFLLHLPRKRGFDAYVADFDPKATYSLVLLDVARDRATRLATLPPFASPPQSASAAYGE